MTFAFLSINKINRKHYRSAKNFVGYRFREYCLVGVRVRVRAQSRARVRVRVRFRVSFNLSSDKSMQKI
jgi:hypothetical protein